MMRLDVGSPFVISAMAEHFQRVLSGCAHGPGVVAASRIISSSAIADDTLHVVAMLLPCFLNFLLNTHSVRGSSPGFGPRG